MSDLYPTSSHIRCEQKFFQQFNNVPCFPITVGFLDVSMVVVVWTPRKVGARIISMRKANDREQRLYRGRF